MYEINYGKILAQLAHAADECIATQTGVNEGCRHHHLSLIHI